LVGEISWGVVLGLVGVLERERRRQGRAEKARRLSPQTNVMSASANACRHSGTSVW
jgi:hypothetical protein